MRTSSSMIMSPCCSWRVLAGNAERRAGVGAGRDPHALRAGRQLEADLGAVERGAEIELEAGVKVLSALRAARASEQLGEVERCAAVVAEVLVVEPRGALLLRTMPALVLARLGWVEAALQRGVAELVVGRALLVIGEHVVRGRALLELLLGGVVARIDVRMMRPRELAIRLANLVGRRRLGDAEDVVQRLCHRAYRTALRQRHDARASRLHGLLAVRVRPLARFVR